MLLAAKAPACSGQGSSLQDYGGRVRLRMRITHSGPANREAALILHMNSVAPHVRMSAGVAHFGKFGKLLRAGGSGLDLPGGGAAPSVS